MHAYAIFHYLPTRQRLIGRAGYRALVEAWLHAFPDAYLEIDSVTTAGDIVNVDFTGRGTLTGELALGEHLVVAPTGRSAVLSFHDRLTIRDGSITESQLDFDVVELRTRLLE